MSSANVRPRWVVWWAFWLLNVFGSFMLKDVWWMRLTWVAFLPPELWAATHRAYTALPSGKVVSAGDTFSECSTWFSQFAKAGVPWWKSWRAAVSLGMIPMLCTHLLFTLSWGPETGFLQYWQAAVTPAVGVLLWLEFHLLNPWRNG